jgi:enoyl-CoA hydratase
MFVPLQKLQDDRRVVSQSLLVYGKHGDASMTFKTLSVTFDQSIPLVALNRPHVLNALDATMFDELEFAFRDLAGRNTVRVILLTGLGEKAFAAGADIKELQLLDAVSGVRKSVRGHAVFGLIETCGKPVIALIHGFALGGGCELAMACSLRLAADTARLGQPETKLGLIPGYGGSQRLPRLVGQGAALKLLLTGEMIDAAEALRIGLVDEVVPDGRLLERGNELARVIAANGPLAVSACLEAVQGGRDIPLSEALRLEEEIFGRLCGTQDKMEGLGAFLDKRKPVWSGR